MYDSIFQVYTLQFARGNRYCIGSDCFEMKRRKNNQQKERHFVNGISIAKPKNLPIATTKCHTVEKKNNNESFDRKWAEVEIHKR